MPILHINYAPAMTAHLVQRGAFADDPLTIVDIGARDGVEAHWNVFGDGVRLIAFEPDAAECERLNDRGDRRVRYLPLALSREGGPRTLKIAKNDAATSFYGGDPAYLERYAGREGLEIVDEVAIDTVTLSTALKDVTPDFMKLDVEGAELEILQGAESLVKKPTMLGLVTEVRFSHALAHCPPFWEMERFCRDCELELYDLDVYRHSKRALPYPHLYDFRDASGRPVSGPTIQGQAMLGDALYFRDHAGGTATPAASSILKLACLFEVFGLNDCAAELVLAHAGAFTRFADPGHLLDLLVPEVKGRRLSYRQYMARDPIVDPLFRPKGSHRFPEYVVPHYDGVFRPEWARGWARRLIGRFLNR